MARLELRPITVKAARHAVKQWHRHLPDIQGGLFAVAVHIGESLRGAGFVDKGVSAGGEHDRPSRRRAPAKRSEPKRRWLRMLASDRPETNHG